MSIIPPFQIPSFRTPPPPRPLDPYAPGDQYEDAPMSASYRASKIAARRNLMLDLIQKGVPRDQIEAAVAHYDEVSRANAAQTGSDPNMLRMADDLAREGANDPRLRQNTMSQMLEAINGPPKRPQVQPELPIRTRPREDRLIDQPPPADSRRLMDRIGTGLDNLDNWMFNRNQPPPPQAPGANGVRVPMAYDPAQPPPEPAPPMMPPGMPAAPSPQMIPPPAPAGAAPAPPPGPPLLPPGPPPMIPPARAPMPQMPQGGPMIPPGMAEPPADPGPVLPPPRAPGAGVGAPPPAPIPAPPPSPGGPAIPPEMAGPPDMPPPDAGVVPKPSFAELAKADLAKRALTPEARPPAPEMPLEDRAMGEMVKPRVGGAGAPPPAPIPAPPVDRTPSVTMNPNAGAVNTGGMGTPSLRKRAPFRAGAKPIAAEGTAGASSGTPLEDALLGTSAEGKSASMKKDAGKNISNVARTTVGGIGAPFGGGTSATNTPQAAANIEAGRLAKQRQTSITGPDDLGRRMSGNVIPRPEGVNTSGGPSEQPEWTKTAKGRAEQMGLIKAKSEDFKAFRENYINENGTERGLREAYTAQTGQPVPGPGTVGPNLIDQTPEMIAERQAKRKEQIQANKDKWRNIAVAKGTATPKAIAQFRREGLFGDEMKKADPLLSATLGDPSSVNVPRGPLAAGAMENRPVTGLTPKEAEDARQADADRAQRGEQFKGEIGFKRENLEANRDLEMKKLQQTKEASEAAEKRLLDAGQNERAASERQHRERMMEMETARINTEYGNKLRERELGIKEKESEREGRKDERGLSIAEQEAKQKDPGYAARQSEMMKRPVEERITSGGYHKSMSAADVEAKMQETFTTEADLQKAASKENPFFGILSPVQKKARDDAKQALAILGAARSKKWDEEVEKNKGTGKPVKLIPPKPGEPTTYEEMDKENEEFEEWKREKAKKNKK